MHLTSGFLSYRMSVKSHVDLKDSVVRSKPKSSVQLQANSFHLALLNPPSLRLAISIKVQLLSGVYPTNSLKKTP